MADDPARKQPLPEFGRNHPDGSFGRGSKVVQVVSDCVMEKGGIAKAAVDFHRAMGGSVLSFTEETLVPAAASAIRHFPYAPRGFARAYGVPQARQLKEASASIRGADLLVIHGLYQYHAQWAAERARHFNIPYWVAPHGSLDPYVFTYRSARKRIWMGFVGRRLLREAEAVLVTTAREAEKAAPYLDGATVEVVPLPVPPAPEISEDERLRFRAAHGLNPEDRVLLFLGRLHPMKRVLETIDAVAEAGDPRIRLVIVGPPSTELTLDACQERARDRSPGSVKIVGPVFGPDKDRWIAAADGLISLSHRENFNYAAAEALAAGKAVILSPGNDLVNELAQVRPGWLLGSFERAEEIAAIRAFAEAPAEALHAMGNAGRAWMFTEASPEAFEARLEALRTGVAGKAAGLV